MIPMLEANWNRPVIVLVAILITIGTCYLGGKVIDNLHKWIWKP